MSLKKFKDLQTFKIFEDLHMGQGTEESTK